MRIEVEDGWNEEVCNVVVTVGGTSYKIPGCYRDRLPDELREFADGLTRGEQFAPELGYEPAFNVIFIAETYVSSLYRRRFRHSWLWWMGSIEVFSPPETIADSIVYLRAFADRLDDS